MTTRRHRCGRRRPVGTVPDSFRNLSITTERKTWLEVFIWNDRTERIGWRRAAVLGANDGIVSTASLIVGVAAANAGRGEILLAGVAGLVASAMSMAAGEYVSVSSQADTEQIRVRLISVNVERGFIDFSRVDLAGHASRNAS